MFTVTGEVWRYAGAGGWHFLTLPPDIADEVRARSLAKPFGSVSAHVTIGEIAWDTSLFADNKRASYLLPLKADVRRRAGSETGATVLRACRLATRLLHELRSPGDDGRPGTRQELVLPPVPGTA